MNQLRNEFAKWMKEMQDGLNQKADYDKLEKAIQDRMNDIVNALTKSFADKDWTKKKIKSLEK